MITWTIKVRNARTKRWHLLIEGDSDHLFYLYCEKVRECVDEKDINVDSAEFIHHIRGSFEIYTPLSTPKPVILCGSKQRAHSARSSKHGYTFAGMRVK